MSSPRSSLRRARRIVCLLGTAVVTEEDGHVAIDRVATAVKQLCDLKKEGFEVIVVTSGAVGIGQDFVRKQSMLQGSLEGIVDRQISADNHDADLRMNLRTCAAAGQVGLMMLYHALFQQCDEPCAQILTTEAQLTDGGQGSTNLSGTVGDLLKLGVVPVVNENDVMSTRVKELRDEQGAILWDNESLAMLVARECFADAVLCVTDTPGLVRAPAEGGGGGGAAAAAAGPVVAQHAPGTSYGAAPGSRVGVQGVLGLAAAADAAVQQGWVRSVVVVGVEDIKHTMAGRDVGTMFVASGGGGGGGGGGDLPHVAQSRL